MRSILVAIFLFGIIYSSSGNSGEYTKSIFITTDAPENIKLEFCYYSPLTVNVKAVNKIIVLFGGRNWKAEKTLRTYNFYELADKYDAILLSPSFKNDEYWQPEKWSGKALVSAIAKIQTECSIANPELYFYGYSAGGQCANLFYFWFGRQEFTKINIKAVALHACGVYPDNIPATSNTPFLITCGEHDNIRFQLSYSFAQRMRESGYNVIFKNYPTGHELNKQSLLLAKCFFYDILLGRTKTKYVAEDFRAKIIPAGSAKCQRIDKEFRNNFTSRKLADMWLGRTEKP